MQVEQTETTKAVKLVMDSFLAQMEICMKCLVLLTWFLMTEKKYVTTLQPLVVNQHPKSQLQVNLHYKIIPKNWSTSTNILMTTFLSFFYLRSLKIVKLKLFTQ